MTPARPKSGSAQSAVRQLKSLLFAAGGVAAYLVGGDSLCVLFVALVVVGEILL